MNKNFIRKNKKQIKELKISFSILFKKFRGKVIRDYLITILAILVWWPILLTIGNVINSLNINELIGENHNYAFFLPKTLQKFITKLNNKEWFILVLSWWTFSFFLEYFWWLWEEELKVRSSNYIESKLLNKFRCLTFEEKTTRGKELSTLIETDAQIVGSNWEFLVRDTFTAITLIILYFISTYVDWKSFIFLGWMALVALISYLFSRIISNNEKKYKEKRAKYSSLVNQEINKGNLIEGMGLNSHYEKQEKHLRKKNEKLKLSSNKFLALANTLWRNSSKIGFIIISNCRNIKGQYSNFCFR